MCCPSSVGNTGVGIEDFGQVWLGFADELLELDYFANLFESEHLVFLVAIDSETGTIIPSIFESGYASMRQYHMKSQRRA